MDNFHKQWNMSKAETWTVKNIKNCLVLEFGCKVRFWKVRIGETLVLCLNQNIGAVRNEWIGCSYVF